MLAINFKVIPHSEQRYETFGDYWYDEEGILQVRVSDVGNPDMEFAAFIHEVIEEHSSKKKGISEPEIKAFDEMFNKETDEGLHLITDEPGEDERAPYRDDHRFANIIEKMLYYFFDIDEKEYEYKLIKLFTKDN
jgi:hypothetical protein